MLQFDCLLLSIPVNRSDSLWAVHMVTVTAIDIFILLVVISRFLSRRSQCRYWCCCSTRLTWLRAELWGFLVRPAKSILRFRVHFDRVDKGDMLRMGTRSNCRERSTACICLHRWRITQYIAYDYGIRESQGGNSSKTSPMLGPTLQFLTLSTACGRASKL